MDNDGKLKTLEEIISGRFVLSKDKKVVICSVYETGAKKDINGYVRSDSRDGYYSVNIDFVDGPKHILWGTCQCESYEYHGIPCKHMLNLRNVYIKNSKKFSKDTTQYGR